MARVLIAGAGYVGGELARILAGGGHEVVALSRTPRSRTAGVRWFGADLTEPASLATLPRQLDFVFYTAAADGSTEADYEAAYVRGLATLTGVLVEQGQKPRRVFFTSSTGVYAMGAGEWADEETAVVPRDATAVRLLEAEALLDAGPFAGTVIRFGGLYGPGRTRLLDMVRAGTAVLHDGPPEYTNRIHRDDAASALAHLLTLPAPAPMYLGVDSEPVTRNEILLFLARELGLPAPRRAPAPPAREGPGQGSNRRYSNRRLLAAGYRFLYPTYREGFRALIAASS